jgi:hypothetical protein
MSKQENYKYCQHIRENGTFCGSGAVKGRAFCCFHLRIRARRLALAQAQLENRPWRAELPPLENMHAVQVALMQVADGLAQDAIEPRRAGLLLYALQQAATNLQNRLAWVNNSPFEISSEEDGIVVRYPGLETEFGLPPRIDIADPPYRVFPPVQPTFAKMTDEEWSGYVQGHIEDLYRHRAAVLKKPPQSAPQKISQPMTTDNRQLTTAVNK